MLLADVNASLTRLGYLPITSAQLAALLSVADYEAWLQDCRARERHSEFWGQLRAAQFAVSQPCAQALARANVRPPLERVVGAVLAQPELRSALVRLYRATDALPVQALGVVRAAFATAGSLKPEQQQARPDRSRWPIHKIHGARYAMAIEHTTDRAGRAVLQIEAAERVPNSKVWDWPAKIIVQLKDPEVIDFLRVLQGKSDRAAFAHHGPNRDKSVEIVAQPTTQNFMLAVRQANTARAVPVPASHAFNVVTLALRVLTANAEGLTASDVMTLIDARPFAGASQ